MVYVCENPNLVAIATKRERDLAGNGRCRLEHIAPAMSRHAGRGISQIVQFS